VLRYFMFSIVVAAGCYLAMRFTAGAVILRDLPPDVPRDFRYLLPGFFAAFISLWMLRPAVRGQTFAGPVVASMFMPFLAGCIFAALLAVFGRSAEEAGDFVTSISLTGGAISDAPRMVLRALPVALPAAFIGILTLRRCDPPEAMTEKKKGRAAA
jgi:hypothetical protein